jgi:tetratricopeptide (TPR) repeat protein
MGLNDLDKGMENAQEEIKYNPELDLGYYAAGEIHFRKKEYPEAIQFLEKAITKNSSSLNALKALAKIKADQGYHAEAREMLLRALKDHQSDPGAHRDLGMVYKNMGQSALAVEEFEVYLQLAPEAPDKAQITSEIATLK